MFYSFKEKREKIHLTLFLHLCFASVPPSCSPWLWSSTWLLHCGAAWSWPPVRLTGDRAAVPKNRLPNILHPCFTRSWPINSDWSGLAQLKNGHLEPFLPPPYSTQWPTAGIAVAVTVPGMVFCKCGSTYLVGKQLIISLAVLRALYSSVMTAYCWTINA